MASVVPLASLVLEEDRRTVQVAANEDSEQDIYLLGEHAHSMSHVVSIVGATHAGKSFVLNRLLSADASGAARVAPDDEDDFAPTTAGSQYSIWAPKPELLEDAHVRNVQAVRLVDYEGAHGGDLAPVEGQDEPSWQPREKESRAQIAQLRREAAGDLLPRLAYLTSDVVVYMTTLSPSDHRSAEDCARFLTASTRNVEREAPSLLLVFNKYSIKKLRKNAKTTTAGDRTEEFLQAHDSDGAMRKLFQDVRVVVLPELDEEGSERDQALFHFQLDQLKRTLLELLQSRLKRRLQWGTAIQGHLWLPLYTLIAEKLTYKEGRQNDAEVIYLSDVLMKNALLTVGADSGVAKQSIDLYNVANHFKPVASRADGVRVDVFEKHCEATLLQLAIVFALDCELTSKHTSFGTSERMVEQAIANFREASSTVLQLIMQYMMPCGAAHNGKHVEGLTKDNVVPCTVRRGDHGEKHRNRFHKSKCSDIAANAFMRAVHRVGNLFRGRAALTQATWRGGYVPPKGLKARVRRATTRTEGTLRWLLTKGTLPIIVAVAFRNLHSLGVGTPVGVSEEGVVAFPDCSLCLGHSGSAASVMQCGHTFCSTCADVLREVTAESVEAAVLEGIPKEDSYVSEFSQAGGCPFCGRPLV